MRSFHYSGSLTELRDFFDDCYSRYSRDEFIPEDPISIPHRFESKQDIEITAFWTAILSWGQRKTIINKATELFSLMDNAPHDFVRNHTIKDLNAFDSFKHRTFQPTDARYFLRFLKDHYLQHDSLEEAFITTEGDLEQGLNQFYNRFFSLPEFPARTRKHLPAPQRKSTCKRICMFLRWMVREDDVDFGLWKGIDKKDLFIPYDIHVRKVVEHFGLLKNSKPTWSAVVELTALLKALDPQDPVKYDFALFGLSASGDLLSGA